jgi:hypothetical protein
MNDHINSDLRFSIIPEWVLDADISDRAIRLYSILARYADNETLQAFPSRETLGKRAFCNAKAVTKAIEELVLIGAVIKQHRKQGESYQSNLYTLRRGGPILTPGRVSFDTGVGSDLTPPRVSDDPLTITTQLEPEELEPLNNINAQFDEFWAAYPRKKGKGQARKAFEKALEKTDLVTILAGVASYVANEDLSNPQFVAHPSTWLNGERWEDEHTEVKVVSKSPYVGGVREWVQNMHDLGEHFECRPGEFGCK